MVYILAVLLAVNLIGFWQCYSDKRRANKKRWRIPEKTFFITAFLGGGFGSIAGLSSANTGFLSGKALDSEEMAQYLTENRFAYEKLAWNTGADGVPVLHLEEDQWNLVQTLELNLFYDDGEGYIDLGLDNVFDFNEAGDLKGIHDGTWLAINGQPVAYYHTTTVDDGNRYTIT